MLTFIYICALTLGSRSYLSEWGGGVSKGGTELEQIWYLYNMHKLVFGCKLHSVEYVILKAFIQSSQDVTFSSAISNSLFTLNCLNILNKRLANTTT